MNGRKSRETSSRDSDWSHWLRCWWPTSRHDGVAALDRALLDVEVALLTVEAQSFFTDDTLDSDVAELLQPHAAALALHVHDADARIRDLVCAGAELADELGVDGTGCTELLAALDDSGVVLEMPTGRREDYALAAGTDGGPRGLAPIARPGRRWPCHPARVRCPAAATHGIGGLGPRLDEHFGDHRRRGVGVTRDAGAGPALGAGARRSTRR